LEWHSEQLLRGVWLPHAERPSEEIWAELPATSPVRWAPPGGQDLPGSHAALLSCKPFPADMHPNCAAPYGFAFRGGAWGRGQATSSTRAAVAAPNPRCRQLGPRPGAKHAPIPRPPHRAWSHTRAVREGGCLGPRLGSMRKRRLARRQWAGAAPRECAAAVPDQASVAAHGTTGIRGRRPLLCWVEKKV